MTRRAPTLANEESLSGVHVSWRLCIVGRSVERSHPLCQRLELVLRQSKCRHTGSPVLNQVVNLFFGAAAQAPVVQQRRTALRTGGRRAVTAGAQFRVLFRPSPFRILTRGGNCGPPSGGNDQS